MKSREERRAEFERREVERKAKYRERMDALHAKSAEQKAARQAAKVDAANAGKPPTRLTLGGMLFPPLGAYQVVKMTSEQVKELNAMTPEERLEFIKRNPGFGSGG